MKRRPILTLTTDFGADGPYVAQMKGVVLGLVPDVQFVDVSHAIPPQDIRSGGFVVGCLIDAFPEGTVHLAVVDPGVGTDRRAIAVRAARQWFVGPDNGLIPMAVGERPIAEARELTNPAHRRATVSPTFHGRDLFATTAAYLLRGWSAQGLGPAVRELVRCEEPGAHREEGGWVGSVVFVDHFGNLLTNLRADRVGPGPWTLTIGSDQIDGMVRTYGERPPGTLVVLEGSSGWLEVAEVHGNASRRLKVGVGEAVRLRG